VDLGERDCLRGTTAEWEAPGQQLVRYNTEGVEVSIDSQDMVVRIRPSQLFVKSLRRHVLGGSDSICHCETSSVCGPSNPKVHQSQMVVP
jgi:hypothetical protein